MCKLMIAGALILGLLGAGCRQSPALLAIQAADEAVARAQLETAPYFPEEVKALSAATADARARFQAGDYDGAIAVANDVTARAGKLVAAASAKTTELITQWNEMRASLQPMITGLADRIGALSAMQTLPKGFDAARLDAAKRSLADITSEWAAAIEAINRSDLRTAVAKAGELKAKAGGLAKMLAAVDVPAAAVASKK